MPTLHEWLNINSIRKYPLGDNTISNLPTNFILDMCILVPVDTLCPVSISSIYLTPAIVSVMVKDADGTCLGIATGRIADAPYFAISIESIAQNISGSITFGKEGIDEFIFTYGAGKHNYDDLSLCANALNFTGINTVSSLGIPGQSVYGDVKLEAGNDIALDYNLADNAITVTLLNKKSFVPECRTNCKDGCATIPIKNISNVLPDVNNNITLEGDGVVVPVSKTEHIELTTPKVQIEDLCANAVKGPTGDPGDPGITGPTGGAGIIVCGEADCCCEVCDTESLEDCENLV